MTDFVVYNPHWSLPGTDYTNGPSITRTVARFVQAPAQDPLVCSGSARQCCLQLWVSCTVVPSALLWLYSEFGADYQCPDSTRLEVWLGHILSPPSLYSLAASMAKSVKQRFCDCLSQRPFVCPIFLTLMLLSRCILQPANANVSIVPFAGRYFCSGCRKIQKANIMRLIWRRRLL